MGGLGFGLGPDEAQYWTWSRALDWAYYSKPPAIAWQIWLSTYFFGQNEIGVRFFSLLIGIFQSLALYRLALAAGLSSLTGFWCGMVMAFSPMGMIGSMLAITDGGFLLFWTCACIEICSALNQQRAPSPIRLGSWICAAALFKWPAFFFWPLLFCFRPHAFKPLIKGVALSALALLPSIWWNSSHDWATFRHVSATLQGGHGLQGGNFFSFLGAQFLLLSPVLFTLLLLAYRRLLAWKELPPPLLFAGLSSLTCLAIGLVLACFQKIQGNWVIFAYPTAILFLVWYVMQGIPRRLVWLKWGTLSSIFLSVFILVVPFVFPLPYPLHPFKQNIGWRHLETGLKAAGYDAAQHFLVGDTYQTSSLLSFYGPQQKRAYFLNLQGVRNNQFSYWPGLEREQLGKDGYFVWVERTEPGNSSHVEEHKAVYTEQLRRHFEKVAFAGDFLLGDRDQPGAKRAFLFKCEKCLSYKIETSSLY